MQSVANTSHKHTQLFIQLLIDSCMKSTWCMCVLDYADTCVHCCGYVLMGSVAGRQGQSEVVGGRGRHATVFNSYQARAICGYVRLSTI
jgi:hypothetical protein